MAAKLQSLKFQETVRAPAAAVYRAFTSSTALREWLCDAAQAMPQAGGRLYLWWNSGYYVSGEFLTATPDKKVAFTWHGQGEPAATRVSVTLAAKGDATRVTLTHGEVGTGKAWAPFVDKLEAGWKAALENLRSTLETGPDLRLVRRPMLGILGGDDVTPANAAKFGVPVTAGLALEGLVEGMGAQAAGLQTGDVVVKLAGKKVTGFQSIPAALQEHLAGDVVPVVFYRGGEKKTLPLTLSARPQPDIPWEPAALAEAVRQQYAESNAELAQCFEGASEAAAAHPPAPGEWSAREVLAHLLLGERGQCDFIAEQIAGQERAYDAFAGNIQPPITALLAVYPTVPELLQALLRIEAETVALLAALPPEFVARKSTYWRLAVNLPFFTLHHQEHLSQIRAALASAA